MYSTRLYRKSTQLTIKYCKISTALFSRRRAKSRTSDDILQRYPKFPFSQCLQSNSITNLLQLLILWYPLVLWSTTCLFTTMTTKIGVSVPMPLLAPATATWAFPFAAYYIFLQNRITFHRLSTKTYVESSSARPWASCQVANLRC